MLLDGDDLYESSYIQTTRDENEKYGHTIYHSRNTVKLSRGNKKVNCDKLLFLLLKLNPVPLLKIMK